MFASASYNNLIKFGYGGKKNNNGLGVFTKNMNVYYYCLFLAMTLTPWQKEQILGSHSGSGTRCMDLLLSGDKFVDVVWHVSWSLSTKVLVVSFGDNKVIQWKEVRECGW
ncbi:hypothetical protein BCR42DRAFT_492286 [Absidia repens]|uniref:WD40-repeat-containing domain protein n=1 Tax=Absidia repens TaxID=90262 RepID=A0A1X2IFD1_9FUNG|nr:hypothetical protein BCR42DRAFT_492286 [Absidia repens]